MKDGKTKIQKPADAIHALEKAEQYVAVLLFNVILFSLFWQAQIGRASCRERV